MKIKTYYIPTSDSSIMYVEGYVNDKGQLLYQDSFGQRILEKEYYFSSMDDAVDELISDIDKEIQRLMNKRIDIIRNYKNEK